jgi:hypothetical protein
MHKSNVPGAEYRDLFHKTPPWGEILESQKPKLHDFPIIAYHILFVNKKLPLNNNFPRVCPEHAGVPGHLIHARKKSIGTVQK